MKNNNDMDEEHFDQLQQRHVQEARNGLDASVARLDWSRSEILEHQARMLRQLLTYSQEHSLYYRRRFHGIDPSSISPDNLQTVLSRLPILNKREVMDHWDEISTDPQLTLAKAQEHLTAVATGGKKNPYFLDKYFIFATGGTTGTRGVFVWDWDLVIDGCQFVMRSLRLLDRRRQLPAAKAVTPKRTALIAAGSMAHASGTVHPIIPLLDEGRQVRRMPLDGPIKGLIDQLNEYQPDHLMVYASVIEQLAQAQIRGELKLNNLDWILALAEPLEEKTRQASLQAWGINVHDGYGSTEIGAIAIESPNHDGMIMAEDSVILEILNDNYILDPNGNRFLLTRLHGKSFPLIRYEVTDNIVLSKGFPSSNEPAPGYRRILRVEGRTDVWFDYGGVKVAPIPFRSVLLRFDSVLEYQVQQTETGAHILLVCKGDVDAKDLARQLCEKLSGAGLKGPVVTTKVVEDLPRHPETNKLKRFVPL